ncbi:hypothetical protein Sjap_017864 [Stephania japonica]|uniref:Reverse transcriptase zinc-binding domain-containing protein n=1 Tax=Stephania japonica TaxID=461633 RepID=A0AAP0I704_9MAGN
MGVFASDSLRIMCPHTMKGGWPISLNKMWALDVSPKVKIFLWHVYRNILPSNFNLGRRKIKQSNLCEICGSEVELAMHARFRCRSIP